MPWEAGAGGAGGTRTVGPWVNLSAEEQTLESLLSLLRGRRVFTPDLCCPEELY